MLKEEKLEGSDPKRGALSRALAWGGAGPCVHSGRRGHRPGETARDGPAAHEAALFIAMAAPTLCLHQPRNVA